MGGDVKLEATSHIAHTGSKKIRAHMCSWLSLSSSVQDSGPWIGATHI